MLDWLALGLLGSLTGSTNTPCPEENMEYHAPGVCADWLYGAPAYAVTYRGGAAPGPASQEIMLAQLDGNWHLFTSGYRWKRDEGSTVVTRRSQREISEADAARLIALTNDATLARLRELHYYGDGNAICTGGASLYLSSGKDRMTQWASQHSCSGPTEINAIAATFREVALKYDPEMEGMLRGFRNEVAK